MAIRRSPPITRDPNTHFVESPALAPPEVMIDMEAQKNLIVVICTCYKQNDMKVATVDGVSEKQITDFAPAIRAIRDRL
ncbi:hypothetical protein Tco_1554521 [Tanacetum coccineum]